MIGKPTQCCTIHKTGNETLTPIRNYPSVTEGILYLLVCLFATFYLYKRLEERNNDRKRTRAEVQ